MAILAYRLLVDLKEVFVTLDSRSAQQSNLIEFQGDDAEVQTVREWLYWEYGAFAHFVRDRCTPIDLETAMNSQRAERFSPIRISGGELILDFNPDIPDGAVT